MSCENKFDRNVVVFDSGIGGLNLLYECVVRVPDLNYYYISDNANVPYGNKSAEEVFRLTRESLKDIERLNPAALVVACNTVTALCIDRLRASYGFPVFGIQPAIKQAANHGGRCLILATEATVRSASFKNLVARFGNQQTSVHACKTLAAYIEENVLNLPDELPANLLPPKCADSVVLGCTHYSYIKKQIERRYKCPVYDGMAGTADHFAQILGMNDHRQSFLGVADHLANFKLNLTFLSGNTNRNRLIFDNILKTNVQD